jgi:PAS domain S-box-containing protein
MTPLGRAARIGGIYALFGFLWILLSDRVLEVLVPSAALTVMQSWKGVFYVAVTALLVVQLARRAFQEQEDLHRRTRASEDRLRAIFDGVGDAIFLHDATSGHVLETNNRVQELFGWSADEAERLGLGALCSGEGDYTEAAALAAVRTAMDQGGLEFPWLARHRDGGSIWVDVKLRRAEVDGRPMVLALVRDARLRRQAEEDLRGSEERFRVLFEQAAVGVLILDLVTVQVERVNRRFCETSGFSPEELLGRAPEHLQHPEFLESNRAGLAALQKGEIREYRQEQRMRRRDGGWVWVDATVSLLPEPIGPPRRAMAVIQDVTVRRQAEAALRDSEERYRLLFDSNPLPMWVFDRDSLAFLAVNDAAVAHYGWSRAEFLSMRISDIRPPEDIPALMDNLARGSGGRDEAGVWRHLKKDGTPIQVEITSHSLDFAFHRAELVLALDVTERLAMQERVAESERRHREVLDSLREAVFVHDGETGRILQVNQRVLEMYRVTEEEVLAEGNFDRYSCHDEGYGAQEAGRWLRLARDVGPQQFEWRSRTGDGHDFWSEVSLRFAQLNDQPCVLAVLRDISERKAAEQALYESEERYRLLFRSLTVGMAVHQVVTDEAGRPVDYVFLEVNSAYERLTGLKAEQVVGRSVRAALPQVDEEWIRRFGAVALTGVPDSFERYSPEVDRAFEVQAYSPRPGQFAVLLRDLSETLRMLEDLRQSSGRLNLLHGIDGAVLESRPLDGILDQALEGLRGLVPVHRAGVVLFQEDGQGVVAAQSGLAIPGLDRGTRLRLRPEVVATLGRNHCVELSLGLADADRYGVHGDLVRAGMGEFLHVPLACQDELLGALNLSRELGRVFQPREQEIAREVAGHLAVAIRQARLQEAVERHARELEQRVEERTRQLQVANEELEAFAYSVSHDLRSPLRAVDGFSRILEEDHGEALDPEARRLLGVIRGSTRRMDQLIADLLSLSRVARADLQPDVVDMESLAREAFLEVLAQEHDAGCELALGSLPHVQGDARLLRQVWRNLLGNAVKFSRGASVRHVTVAGGRRDGHCWFEVRDQGAGFDPAFAHKLFGVFQRLHGEHEFEGSGVGLALVRRIVRRHGGEVEAAGEVGKGATFRFTLPCGLEEA